MNNFKLYNVGLLVFIVFKKFKKQKKLKNQNKNQQPCYQYY